MTCPSQLPLRRVSVRPPFRLPHHLHLSLSPVPVFPMLLETHRDWWRSRRASINSLTLSLTCCLRWRPGDLITLSYRAVFSILQHQHPSLQLLPRPLLNQLSPSSHPLRWETGRHQHPGQKNSKPEQTDKPITTLPQTLLLSRLRKPRLWPQSLVSGGERQRHQPL